MGKSQWERIKENRNITGKQDKTKRMGGGENFHFFKMCM